MRRLSFFLFTACVTILASCSGRIGRLAGEGGDTLRLRYAERLSIVDCGDYTVATIANPWKPGQTLHT